MGTDEAVEKLAEATQESLVSLRARGCAWPDGRPSLSHRSLAGAPPCSSPCLLPVQLLQLLVTTPATYFALNLSSSLVLLLLRPFSPLPPTPLRARARTHTHTHDTCDAADTHTHSIGRVSEAGGVEAVRLQRDRRRFRRRACRGPLPYAHALTPCLLCLDRFFFSSCLLAFFSSFVCWFFLPCLDRSFC